MYSETTFGRGGGRGGGLKTGHSVICALRGGGSISHYYKSISILLDTEGVVHSTKVFLKD